MANSLTLADAVATANTGLDAIKRAPIVEEDTGIKCIRIQDVNQEKQFSEWGNTEVEARNLEKFQLKENDILIARTGGSVGSNKFIDKEYPAVYNNGLIRVRVDEGNHDSKFIYYLMQTEAFKSHINAIAYSTSAQPNMKIKDFLRFEFKELGLKAEKSIQSILSCLDNKIELNRQTNQTLEQMAQTLFKSWFVDFDPVFDSALASGMAVKDFPEALQKKAEQRQQVQQQIANGELDTKPLPDDIQQLFPSEFEQTGDQSIGINGWIPKEWKPRVLSDLLDVKYGKDHKKLDEGSYPVYGSGGLMRNVDKFLYEGESVLIPRKGTLTNIMYVNETFWTVDTMFFTKPKMNNVAKFSFYLLKRLDFNNMNVGSAVPSMTTKVLNALQVVYPSESVLAKFDELVELYFSKTRDNDKNTKQLEKLRDTLLPKLISGEISINSIQ